MEESLLDDFIDFISACVDIQEDLYKKQLKLSMEISKFSEKNDIKE
jgi:hypothetical protein